MSGSKNGSGVELRVAGEVRIQRLEEPVLDPRIGELGLHVEEIRGLAGAELRRHLVDVALGDRLVVDFDVRILLAERVEGRRGAAPLLRPMTGIH